MTYHDAARPRDIHVIHQFEFTNQGNMDSLIDLNMGSLSLTSNDIGKVARRLDTGNFYLLTNHSPVTWAQWGGAVGKHSGDDKKLVALVTSSDGDPAFTGAISKTPLNGGYVQVFVNGKKVALANGPSIPGDCYFSGDGGTTRRLIGAIVVGDTLHWVGSFAGYELETSDRIDLDYEEN
jgi:hypothetical protein